MSLSSNLRSRLERLALPTAMSAWSAAIVFASVAAPSALAGPTVKVRVEEEGATLLPQTTVTLDAPEPVSGCPADSVAAAINLAVAGDWDHGEAAGSGGDFTETILGQTESFEDESSTWAIWVNYKWGTGICEQLLNEGEEVLVVADHEPPPYSPTVLPLIVEEAPSTVSAGESFAVKVDAVHTPAGTFPEQGQGTPEPAAGVTVSAPGVSAVTGSEGVARLTLANPGLVTLKAAGHGFAASLPFTVCVHAPGEAACGSVSPNSSPSSTPISAPSPLYKGPYALVADVTSLANGRHYAPGAAPRLISGRISSHSSVTSVSLSLRRSWRGRCSAYDATRGRFVKARCGTAPSFAVSKEAAFSYLLPAKLAPGRYVLDVQAGDVAGNTVALARGTSRIVFYVR